MNDEGGNALTYEKFGFTSKVKPGSILDRVRLFSNRGNGHVYFVNIGSLWKNG